MVCKFIYSPELSPDNIFSQMKAQIILGLLLLTVACLEDTNSLQTGINFLYNKLFSRYWAKDTKFNFPISEQHTKGLFESTIHFNAVDKHNGLRAEAVRKNFKLDDSNMFVTSFVLFGLLEAQQLGTVDIDEHKFSESLMALVGFKDRNVQSGIPQYNFW